MAIMIDVNGDLVSIGRFYAAMYWGFVVSTSFVGISIVQGYLYFTRNNNDRCPMKVLVFILLILDPITTILMAETIYYYFFVNYGVVEALGKIPIAWTIESGLTVLVTAVVQVFFASRIYTVNNSVGTLPFGRTAPILVFLSALVAFVVGTVRTTYIGVRVTPHFSRTLFQFLVVIEESSALVSDLLASACLCYILKPPRLDHTGRPETFKILFMFMINRAILMSMVQIGMLVSYLVAKDFLYWVPFALFKSKLYTNTLLAMLNSRSGGSFQSQSTSQPLWTLPFIDLSAAIAENSMSTSEGPTEKASPSQENVGPESNLSDPSLPDPP